MASLKETLCLFLRFLSLVRTEQPEIFVVDVVNPNDDDVQLLNNYDDYDPISQSDYDYDYAATHRHPREHANPNHENFLDFTKKPLSLHLPIYVTRHDCNRLFGSMYGAKVQRERCIENLKAEQHHYGGRNIKFVPYNYYNELRHQKLHKRPKKPFNDLTRFSQDYLDVKDLSRKTVSSRFATDYVDVNEFRVTDECDTVQLDEFGVLTKANCVSGYA